MSRIKGMEYTEWLETLTNDSQADVAKKIGISRRTLQNQLYGPMKMETVVKIAEAYGLNPHRALSELAFIDAHWLKELVGDRRAALIAAEEEELSDEVLRRMLRGVKTDALTTDVNELVGRHLAVADSSPDHDEEDQDFFD